MEDNRPTLAQYEVGVNWHRYWENWFFKALFFEWIKSRNIFNIKWRKCVTDWCGKSAENHGTFASVYFGESLSRKGIHCKNLPKRTCWRGRGRCSHCSRENWPLGFGWKELYFWLNWYKWIYWKIRSSNSNRTKKLHSKLECNFFNHLKLYKSTH